MMNITNVPNHVSNLSTFISNKQGKAGVYIWGFLYNKKKNQILDFADVLQPMFNVDLHQFIPFYVGQSRDIYKRLGNHSLVRSNDSVKWQRFTMNFMLEFYKWIPLQKHTTKYHAEYMDIHNHTKGLVFYSEVGLMKHIYPHLKYADIDFYYKRGQAGIADVQGRLKIKDTLSDIINNRNNFWYMEVDQPIPDAKKRKDCEAMVHLALKGGVISRYHNPAPNVVIQASPQVIALGIFEVNTKDELVNCPCHGQLSVSSTPPKLRDGYNIQTLSHISLNLPKR